MCSRQAEADPPNFCCFVFFSTSLKLFVSVSLIWRGERDTAVGLLRWTLRAYSDKARIRSRVT